MKCRCLNTVLETDPFPGHPCGYRENPQCPVLRGENHCPYCLRSPCVIIFPLDFPRGSCGQHPANYGKRQRLYKMFWRLLSDLRMYRSMEWRGVFGNEGGKNHGTQEVWNDTKMCDHCKCGHYEVYSTNCMTMSCMPRNPWCACTCTCIYTLHDHHIPSKIYYNIIWHKNNDAQATPIILAVNTLYLYHPVAHAIIIFYVVCSAYMYILYMYVRRSWKLEIYLCH